MSSGCHHALFVHTTALGLCFALIGCVSSRGLHTTGTLTDPPQPQGRTKPGRRAAESDGMARGDWWIGFGDPQLTALINEALRNNPSLDEVEARARQAQAVADGADANRRPRVDLNSEIAGAELPRRIRSIPNTYWASSAGSSRQA